MLDTYTEGFTSLKANRTLEWKAKLGVVELSLELADRVVELSVSPAQAAVVMAFQDQSELSVSNNVAIGCYGECFRFKVVGLWMHSVEKFK